MEPKPKQPYKVGTMENGLPYPNPKVIQDAAIKSILLETSEEESSSESMKTKLRHKVKKR